MSKKSTVRRAFYRNVLVALQESRIPFVVGGAFAFSYYSGVRRPTKDLDVFVPQAAWGLIEESLGAVGIDTELTFTHWLGKARHGEHFVDMIFCGANGVTRVDEEWVQRAPITKLMDLDVRMCPVEEMIWSKAFVMERERFDGADVLHLLRAMHAVLDWHHLLARFGEHWPVLLAHLTLFKYVYPSAHDAVPAWVMDELTRRQREGDDPHTDSRVCRGTLLSRAQYLVDVERWGYHDARVPPFGTVHPSDMQPWTAEIDPKLRPDTVARTRKSA